MNVAHIIGSFNHGGTEMLLTDLIKNNSKNYKHFIIHFKGGSLADNLKEKKDVVHIKRNSFNPLFLFKLRTFIKRNKINVIHIHQPVYILYAFIALMFLNKSLYLTLHGYRNTLFNKYLLLISSYICKKIFFVSEQFLQSVKHQSGLKLKNAKVVYNGIDTGKIYRGSDILKKELKIPEDSVLFGMIGNFFTDVRDHITTCKAFNMIYHKYTNAVLVFVGGYNENSQNYKDCYDYCKSRNILDRVYFLGYRGDINNILESIDLFVYSSNRDSFGIAVIEAMIYGKPVLVNNLNVFLELSDNGKFINIYKTKNPNDFADKMEDFLINKNKYLKKSVAAKKWARQKYSIQNHIKVIENIYSKELN